MDLKIKVLKKTDTAKLPVRATDGSAGFDVFSDQTVHMEANVPVLVDTGLVISLPEGWYYTLHIRSGISVKNTMSLVNDVGIIDNDYNGVNDRLKVPLMLHGNPNIKPYMTINRGERIAQIIFKKMDFSTVTFEEFSTDDEYISSNEVTNSRGGFGSTGDTDVIPKTKKVTPKKTVKSSKKED